MADSQVEESISPYGKLGMEAGRLLLDRCDLLQDVKMRIRQDMQKEKEELEKELVNTRAKIYETEARYRRSRLFYHLRRKQRRQEENTLMNQPDRMSLTKGVLYLALAGLVLAADFVFLAEVLSETLGFPIVGESGYRLGGMLSRPLLMFRELTEATLLTATALILGFFYKIYRDQLSSESRKKWDTRLWRVTLFLSGITIVAFASLRYPMLPDWLTGGIYVVIGVALPLIATGFFVCGFEPLHRRLRYTFCYKVAERFRFRKYRQRRSEHFALVGERRNIERQIAYISSREAVNDRAQRAVFEFSSGYARGVGQIAGGAEFNVRGLFGRIAPVVTSRQLRGKAGNGLACILFVLAATSAGCGGDLPPRDLSPSSIAIIFDPTILDGYDTAEMKRIVSKAAGLLPTVPPGSKIFVAAVGPLAANVRPLFQDSLQRRRDANGQPKEQKRIEDQARASVEPALRREWDSAHAGANVLSLRSCIFDALFGVHNLIKVGGSDDESRNVHLVIVSDMVEACSNTDINLSQGFLSFSPPSWFNESEWRDGVTYCSLTVLRVKHKAFSDPTSILELEGTWKPILGTMAKSVSIQGVDAPVRFDSCNSGTSA